MVLKRQMLRGTMVVGFFSLLGSLTGILVETAIAAKLGLTKSSDTFYAALTVPYIITNLIAATGQFSLVPFFTSLSARHSREELWKGFSYVVNLIFLGLTAIAVLGAGLAWWLMKGLAPGFVSWQTALAAQLGRRLFFMIIPAGIAEAFRSFLLSQRRYALASATRFIRNGTVIVFILFGFRHYGEYSIVLGYLAGFFAQFAILGTYILLSFPVRYSLTFAGSGEAFRKLRGAGAAQLATALGWQGVIVVERIIASFLLPGTLTALSYGMKIMSTLMELLAGSIGTATLPVLSHVVASKGLAEAWKTFRDALRFSLVLVAPAVVFCLLLDRNIIKLIFERGNFTPQATILMTMIFFYYSLSLLPISFIRLLNFYLFARHEVASFIRLATLQYFMTAAFDLFYVLVLSMGPKGIPLGLLTSVMISFTIAIRRNLGDLKRSLDRSLAVLAAKALLGCAFAALVIVGLESWVTGPRTGIENFLYLCKLCGAGTVVFLLTLAVSRAVTLSQVMTFWRQAEDV